MKFLKRRFVAAPEGNGRAVLHCISAASRSARPLPARLNRPCRSPQSLHSDFFDTRLRWSLFDVAWLKGKISPHVLAQSSFTLPGARWPKVCSRCWIVAIATGPPPSQRRESLQTTFLAGSGGNGRVVLHCIFSAPGCARPLPARVHCPS